MGRATAFLDLSGGTVAFEVVVPPDGYKFSFGNVDTKGGVGRILSERALRCWDPLLYGWSRCFLNVPGQRRLAKNPRQGSYS